MRRLVLSLKPGVVDASGRLRWSRVDAKVKPFQYEEPLSSLLPVVLIIVAEQFPDTLWIAKNRGSGSSD